MLKYWASWLAFVVLALLGLAWVYFGLGVFDGKILGYNPFFKKDGLKKTV